MLSDDLKAPTDGNSLRGATAGLVALSTALILIAAGPAISQTTVVLCDSHNPPLVEGKEDGSVATGGRVVDLLDEAFKQIEDASVEVRVLPWARCIQEARTGRKDGIAKLFKNDERAEFMEFTAEPLLLEVTRFFYLDERFPEGLTWETLADLSEYRVGIAEGSSYGALADEAISSGILKTDAVAADLQNMKKLLAGRVDLVLNDERLGAVHARDAGGENRIKASEQAVSIEGVYLGFSKRSEALGLLPAIDAVLAELRQQGVTDRIMEGE